MRRRRLAGRFERSALTRSPDEAEALTLADLISRLDPDRRAAFTLTQVLGLGYADAAEICDCPVGTIRSRVARARADLMAALDVDAPQGTDAATRR
jgi:RNA polymerase sigma-70 factor (ECF subfamily)